MNVSFKYYLSIYSSNYLCIKGLRIDTSLQWMSLWSTIYLSNYSSNYLCIKGLKIASSRLLNVFREYYLSIIYLCIKGLRIATSLQWMSLLNTIYLSIYSSNYLCIKGLKIASSRLLNIFREYYLSIIYLFFQISFC